MMSNRAFQVAGQAEMARTACQQSEKGGILRVDEALEKLAAAERVKAGLVKLRYFAGLSIPETGRALGLSESTAKGYWTYARAWLYDVSYRQFPESQPRPAVRGPYQANPELGGKVTDPGRAR